MPKNGSRTSQPESIAAAPPPPAAAGRQRRAPAHPTSDGFRLVRYFSWASGLVIVAVAIGLTWFYAFRAEQALLQQGEQKNAAQLKLLLNHLADVDRATLLGLLGRGDAPSRDDPNVRRMLDLSGRSVAGTSIVKLKLYNLQGLTVFSSELKQIGEDKATYPGFVAARGGIAASQLSQRESFESIGGTLRQVDVIGSYLPVRGDNGRVIGVAEVYDNVTPLAAAIRATRWEVMGLSALLLSGLYLALLVIIGRADGILRDRARAIEVEIDKRSRIAEELRRSVQATEAARRETERAYAAALSARREAEAATNAKAELLQVFGESLRTPVNRAIGLMDVLQAGLATDAQREQLTTARAQLTELLQMLTLKLGNPAAAAPPSA